MKKLFALSTVLLLVLGLSACVSGEVEVEERDDSRSQITRELPTVEEFISMVQEQRSELPGGNLDALYEGEEDDLPYSDGDEYYQEDYYYCDYGYEYRENEDGSWTYTYTYFEYTYYTMEDIFNIWTNGLDDDEDGEIDEFDEKDESIKYVVTYTYTYYYNDEENYNEETTVDENGVVTTVGSYSYSYSYEYTIVKEPYNGQELNNQCVEIFYDDEDGYYEDEVDPLG